MPDNDLSNKAYRLGRSAGRFGVTDLLKNEHIAEEVGGMPYVGAFWRGVWDCRRMTDEDPSSATA